MTPLITIATPTYNRADTLPRVYDSLCLQKFNDFEWLVIDDGSTDGTRELVHGWQRQSPFPVRYIWQHNQHKKVAMNHAVREARGRYIVFVDSDDRLLPEALWHLLAAWEAIPEGVRSEFVGVTGLCLDPEWRTVGTRFPTDPLDVDSLTARYVFGIRGDKCGFQRVDVMRQYPFPEFATGAVPEGYVWDRIAMRYKTRFINEAILTIFPTAGSLSRPTDISLQDYDGHLFYISAFLDEIAPHLWSRAPGAVFNVGRQYSRFCLHMRRQGRAVRWRPTRATSLIVLFMLKPLGLALYLKDISGVRRGKARRE